MSVGPNVAVPKAASVLSRISVPVAEAVQTAWVLPVSWQLRDSVLRCCQNRPRYDLSRKLTRLPMRQRNEQWMGPA